MHFWLIYILEQRYQWLDKMIFTSKLELHKTLDVTEQTSLYLHLKWYDNCFIQMFLFDRRLTESCIFIVYTVFLSQLKIACRIYYQFCLTSITVSLVLVKWFVYCWMNQDMPGCIKIRNGYCLINSSLQHNF